jgi:hypothetical protein
MDERDAAGVVGHEQPADGALDLDVRIGQAQACSGIGAKVCRRALAQAV